MAIALKVVMRRWMRAPISYTTVYDPPNEDEEHGGIDAAMCFSLYEIMATEVGPEQWTAQAINHVQLRVKSLALIKNIIKNTPPLQQQKRTQSYI